MRWRWAVAALVAISWTGALAAACGAPGTPVPEPLPGPAPSIRLEAMTTARTDKPGPTLSVDKPAGLSLGQVALAQVSSRARGAVTVTPPDGWVQLGVTQGTAAGGTADLSSWLFLRVADEDEPARYDFTATGAAAMVASIGAFSHVDSATPVDTFAGGPTTAGTALEGPPLTTNSGNTVAVWLGTQLTPNGCAAAPVTAPNGFTAAGRTCTPTGAGLSLGVGVRQLGAGSVQPRWSGKSTTSAAGLVQVVALRPAGAGSVDDDRPPAAQAADEFAREPAPSLVGPGKFGYLLWDGDDPRKDVQLGQDVLYQPSGLAASRRSSQILFVNSEKDKGTMIAVNNRDGQVLGRYSVAIPDLFDWEDLAAGPCPAGSCLYAADIGFARDVAKPTKGFSVTRFAEPDVSGGQTSGELSGDTFPFTYPGAARDAEAIMVHPGTGDIYVLTKQADGRSEVFRFPDPLPAPGVTSELVKVADLDLPTDPKDPEAAKVTAAAAHPVANRFLVRTYRHVYEFRGSQSGSFADAFGGRRVELTDPKEGQGESITYAIDGSAYYTLSEAVQPPYRLNRVDRT